MLGYWRNKWRTLKMKFTQLSNRLYQISLYALIFCRLKISMVRPWKYYSQCKNVPILRLQKAIESGDKRHLLKLKNYNNLPFGDFGFLEDVYFELLAEYETLKGSKGVKIFFRKLKQISKSNYKINISFLLFRFYDFSDSCKSTLEELGYKGKKEEVLRKIRVDETNFKLRKAEFDSTYNQTEKTSKSFYQEVLTVRMALGGMDLDLKGMTALEWVETVKTAKEHARNNNSERINQSGRTKATRRA
jgi:hypothetical protein